MDERIHTNGLNRREFLRGTAAVAAAGLSGLTAVQGAEEATGKPGKRTPTDLVPLGGTGLTVSRMALGTGMKGGNRQSNQTKLGFEKFVGLLRHAYDSGIRFFDMADLYGSHVYVREALRFIPREKMTLLTKIWWHWGESPNTIVERFRHELATDYIDIVLLHCVRDADWDKTLVPYMDMLSELKAKKQVRAVGTSIHALEGLRTTAVSPWADVAMTRINPKGVKMDGPPDQVVPMLKQMHENRKGVVGIKIFGEGSLVNMQEECLRYAYGLDCVHAMSIGFESCEQIDDTLKRAERVLQSA